MRRKWRTTLNFGWTSMFSKGKRETKGGEKNLIAA
jgi:hypothetical protein